jgi:hypothetical protein
LIVGSGFKADEDEVAEADFARRAGTFGPDTEVPRWAVDQKAVAADGVVVRTQQEVRLMASAGEFSAVKAPDGTAANDRDFQAASTKKHSERTQSAFGNR